MNNNIYEDDAIEIDLTSIFYAVRKWIVVICLTGLLGAIAAFAVTKLLMTPMYTAETRIMVLASESNSNTTMSDLQMGTQLANDYKELAISRPVLDAVIEELDLDMTRKALKGSITLSSPSNTRILVIRVEHESPETALAIARAVANEACDYTGKLMGVTPPRVADEGVVPEEKSSPSTMKNVAIGLLAGLFLSGGIVVLQCILDDTIKTEEDVEKRLGLPTLSVVPDRKDFINQSKDKNAGGKLLGKFKSTKKN